MLEAALPLDELDSLMIRMDEQMLITYAKQMAEIYDACAHTLRGVLRQYCFDSCPALLSAFMDEKFCLPRETPPEIPCSYPAYPDESPLIALSHHRFHSPLIRRVEIRAIAAEQGRVQLQCATASNTPVLVFRRTAHTPWCLVKKAFGGRIYDEQVTPQTQYQYLVCTETEQNGRHYIGAYAAEKSVVTAVATPHIQAVIQFAGCNTVMWDPVSGAEGYYLYHKHSQAEDWKRCAAVGATATQWSEPEDSGSVYTIRAFPR
ncbi:MAG: hypothetical protein PHS97_01820 [Oscillospiraceae bacterium]|nr:hypothetical protein [Oscillospiraceae bacterium]